MAANNLALYHNLLPGLAWLLMSWSASVYQLCHLGTPQNVHQDMISLLAGYRLARPGVQEHVADMPSNTIRLDPVHSQKSLSQNEIDSY